MAVVEAPVDGADERLSADDGREIEERTEVGGEEQPCSMAHDIGGSELELVSMQDMLWAVLMRLRADRPEVPEGGHVVVQLVESPGCWVIVIDKRDSQDSGCGSGAPDRDQFGHG